MSVDYSFPQFVELFNTVSGSVSHLAEQSLVQGHSYAQYVDSVNAYNNLMNVPQVLEPYTAEERAQLVSAMQPLSEAQYIR